MKIRKEHWSVKQITLTKAGGFVEKWHYAHKAGALAHRCFGLFYKGDLTTIHGVAVWNPPPPGAAKSVDKVNHQTVLGLSRFCLVEDRPENSGSFLISGGIKLLDKRWRTLLTYADTAENHTGGLYRASNWNYSGLTRKNPVYRDKNGHLVSRKKGPKTFGKKDMIKMGYEFKGNYAKHIFLYPRNRSGIVVAPRPAEYQQTELIFTEQGNIVPPNDDSGKIVRPN